MIYHYLQRSATIDHFYSICARPHDPCGAYYVLSISYSHQPLSESITLQYKSTTLRLIPTRILIGLLLSQYKPIPLQWY